MLAEIIIFTTELVFGYLIPVFATLCVLSKFKSVNSQEDYKRWMSYWVCVGIVQSGLSCISGLAPNFAQTAVNFVRTCALLFLGLPQTKGSLLIWNKYLTNEVFIGKVELKFFELFKKLRRKLGDQNILVKLLIKIINRAQIEDDCMNTTHLTDTGGRDRTKNIDFSARSRSDGSKTLKPETKPEDKDIQTPRYRSQAIGKVQEFISPLKA